MSNSTEATYDINLIREVVYGDVISPSTEKNGKALLFVAGIALIVAVFDVEITSTPFLPINFSKHPEVLLTFLAILNAALLLSYLLRSANDFFRSREGWLSAQRELEKERVAFSLQIATSADEAMFEAERASHDNGMEPEEYWLEHSEISKQAAQNIADLTAAILERKNAIRLRVVRLFVFAGVPIIVGVFAFVHTWREAGQFLELVMGL